jgi:hypothetical protein
MFSPNRGQKGSNEILQFVLGLQQDPSPTALATLVDELKDLHGQLSIAMKFHLRDCAKSQVRVLPLKPLLQKLMKIAPSIEKIINKDTVPEEIVSMIVDDVRALQHMITLLSGGEGVSGCGGSGGSCGEDGDSEDSEDGGESPGLLKRRCTPITHVYIQDALNKLEELHRQCV